MTKNKRKENRFPDIGKATCSELCIFSGVLLDVSLTGCRIRFPAVLRPDKDQDYELSISFFNKTANRTFLLIGHLRWLRSEKNTTEVGLSFMHSPDTKFLSEYILQISAKEQIRPNEHNFFMEEEYV